jgi:hypothetical protein
VRISSRAFNSFLPYQFLLLSPVSLPPDLDKIIIYERFSGLAGVPFEANDEISSPSDLADWESMDRDGTIDINAFRADMIQRGYDSNWADATFHAFDLGKDSRINKYEYYLGVLLATQSEKLAQFTDSKWMEFRSKLLFYFYCRSDYETIGYKEMSRFLRDYNSTDSKIATDLMKLDIFSPNWTCSFTEFHEILQQEHETMRLNHLDLCQLNRLSATTLAKKKRVTLDTRLITTSNASIVSMLKTHVSQTVPTCGKAPGLIIDDDLIPQYEWPQSILYSRNDNAHKIATFILQQTIGLVHLQLNQEKIDQPSE